MASDLSQFLRTENECHYFFISGIDGTTLIESSLNGDHVMDVVWDVVANTAMAKPMHNRLRARGACRFDLEPTTVSTLVRAATLCRNQFNVTLLSRRF